MSNVDKVLQMSRLCDRAIEFIQQVLPNGYYMDDCSVDEDRIEINIFDSKREGAGRVDRFSFRRFPDVPVEERLTERLNEWKERWN